MAECTAFKAMELGLGDRRRVSGSGLTVERRDLAKQVPFRRDLEGQSAAARGRDRQSDAAGLHKVKMSSRIAAQKNRLSFGEMLFPERIGTGLEIVDLKAAE